MHDAALMTAPQVILNVVHGHDSIWQLQQHQKRQGNCTTQSLCIPAVHTCIGTLHAAATGTAVSLPLAPSTEAY